ERLCASAVQSSPACAIDLEGGGDGRPGGIARGELDSPERVDVLRFHVAIGFVQSPIVVVVARLDRDDTAVATEWVAPHQTTRGRLVRAAVVLGASKAPVVKTVVGDG